jgi:hypothetical protein
MSSIPTAFRNLARNTACNTSSLVIGPFNKDTSISVLNSELSSSMSRVPFRWNKV